MKFIIQRKKMIPHQLRFWENCDQHQISLLIGGYGSGKTWIGAMRSIYLSFINAPLPGMYVSPTHGMAQKTIILTLKEMMNRAEMDYTFNQNKGEFHIHNWNGMIYIGSGDHPSSLRGMNLAWAGIDEPFIQSKEVFDQIMARVRHPEAEKREVFLTGTPESLNFGYQLTRRDDLDMGVVVGSTLDNPYLPREYIQSLLTAYSPEQIDAYLHGKFVNLTQGRVYYSFDREKHMMKRETDGWEIGAGIDFNVDQLSACIFAHTKKEIAVIGEIRLKNAGTWDLAEAIKKKYPGIRVYPDATGSARKTSASLSDHDILRQSGFQVMTRRANPRVRDRVNSVNRMLRKELITFANCPTLIMDMEMNVWRNNDLDKRDPEQTHMSDALGYACHFLMPVIKHKATKHIW